MNFPIKGYKINKMIFLLQLIYLQIQKNFNYLGGFTMVYKKFQDLNLSALGMGCMRLPCIEKKDSKIDEAETAKMLDYALKHGVNYIDTAWGYHNGNSELVMGKLLKNYPRDSFYLATKFPGYDLSNMPKVKEIFEKQLKKCQVDYFDFYLFHNVCEMNIREYLDASYGIYDYLLEQKKNGRIRHLGFSCHGTLETLKRFLDAYGDSMEFCQIQLNWLDFTFQDAKAKVELLNEHHIPIWVMEPLRGGSLAKLHENYEDKMKQMRKEEEIPAWAFRFLQSISGVTVTLSGMSNMEQLQHNIETFETEKPLNSEEQKLLSEIAAEMTSKKTLPCTACHYCVSHCPKELDIPYLLSLYNEHIYSDGGFLAPMAMAAIPKEKQPLSCIGCGSCEKVCPQNIKIPQAMKDFTEKLASAKF